MTETQDQIQPITETPKPASYVKDKNLLAKPAHYVDNKKFLAALIEYREQVVEAEKQGLERPRVSNYLGECFIKIATHLSYKSNFINYSFKDDMISDGIENCLTAVGKFDPARSSNPFAYYTQVIYFAFVRRIQKEKKQQATKYKFLENIDIDQIITQAEGNEEMVNHLLEMVRKQSDSIDPARKEIKSSMYKKKKVEKLPNLLDNLE
jgi:DNA-directed RNA polymerase specialized sigma subunit